ncbi:hypothetical protein CDAR_515661 [Caerostris darwini]|uniref:Uncharacterized protein n=1 Tax=Caerostris darwini TaxID=1538125 RepID=A0AAV4S0Z4_9ARAC|nr:hypothetical protein CDAR_515661 [Caerostris darwini]
MHVLHPAIRTSTIKTTSRHLRTSICNRMHNRGNLLSILLRMLEMSNITKNNKRFEEATDFINIASLDRRRVSRDLACGPQKDTRTINRGGQMGPPTAKSTQDRLLNLLRRRVDPL